MIEQSKLQGELSKVVEFAREKHKGQLYGQIPYIFHLYEVFGYCCIAKLSNVGKKIALLHDVLEDTDATAGEIESLFGADVLQGVLLLTGVGANRKEKMLSLKTRLLASDNLEAMQVKVIDRFVNVRHAGKSSNMGLLRMYEKEHADFMEIIAHAKSLDKPNADIYGIYSYYENVAYKYFQL